MQKNNPRARKPKFRKVKKHVHVVCNKETCNDKMIEINTPDGVVYKTIGVHIPLKTYEVNVLRAKPEINKGFPRNPYGYFSKQINALRERLDVVTGNIVRHVTVKGIIVDQLVPKETIVKQQIEKYEELRRKFIDSNPAYVPTI